MSDGGGGGGGFSGGGGSSYSDLAAQPAYPQSNADVIANAKPNIPTVGFSTPFSSDSGGAVSGSSGTSSQPTGGVFASLSNPTGQTPTAFDSGGAQPFQTFGNVAQPTGFSAPLATGAVGAPAVSIPAGVSPQGYNVDPTSAAAQPGNQLTPDQLGQSKPAQAAQTPQAASSGNTFTDAISKNPFGAVGALAAGGGLVNNLIQGQKPLPAYSQLQQLSQQLGPEASQLKSYLANGTLPPGLQASVDQSTAAAKARIISQYATRNQSTDPNQNSALAQELAGVDQTAVATAGQLAVQLYQQGLSETQMNQQIYAALLNADQAQAKQTQDALGGFAAALGRLGPSGGGLSLKLA